MVLTIVLAVAAVWLLLSVLLALAFGRTVRLADRRHEAAMAYRAARVRPTTRAKVPARV